MTNTRIHDEALQWFVQLSDQDAPESAWLAFQAWLEADPGHGKAYASVEQVWVTLDDPALSKTRIDASATSDSSPQRGRTPRTGRRTVFNRGLTPLLAAAAATILVVGLWPEVTGMGRFHTFTTEDAGREVVLSDGSHLSMNRHSELKARVGSRGRSVILKGGEVAFDVQHDVRRPFVVSAGDHQVRVLGTAFNVLSDGGRFSVGVQRGQVAVSGDGLSDDIRLGVGQRLEQVGTGVPVLSPVDPGQTSTWRQGVLVYRETAISDVAHDLSRYLDKPVTVSASAGALRFTGALRIGDEATMLRQLQDYVAIDVTRSRDGIRVTTRDGA